jgi:hypothetical protein
MKALIIIAHAFVGWALCGAIMGIGLATTTENTAVIIHLIGAPLIFALVSLIYFRKYNFTNPLATAAAFLAFVICMDIFVVALMINQSFEMFKNPLGTWLPFALLFLSTFTTGKLTTRKTDAT